MTTTFKAYLENLRTDWKSSLFSFLLTSIGLSVLFDFSFIAILIGWVIGDFLYWKVKK